MRLNVDGREYYEFEAIEEKRLEFALCEAAALILTMSCRVH